MDVVDPRPGAVATSSTPDEAPVGAEVAQPDAVEPETAEPEAAEAASAEQVGPDAVEAESAAADAAEPVDAATDAAEPESAAAETAGDDAPEPDDAVVEAVEPDDVADVAEPDDAVAGPTPSPDAPAARPSTPPTRVTRRRSPLRRAAAIGALTAVAALAVSAFATVGPSTRDPDQRFVDAAVSQGHTLGTSEQQALVVSAARKICDRKESHSTVADRKANALSSAELGAVTATFDADARGFTDLALKTYCAR